ncbi:MAG: helix-turn-helix domain-containing protein [Deltaproteobacteria bacterium]|nr:helix-turn-helix domain-containing protein [Deltaproteobacteria bacterium]
MIRELPRRVQSRRRQLGWTQSDLARAMGSSPSRVCKLEAGDESVAPSLMLRALVAMDAPLRLEIDKSRDAFAEPGLTAEQRRQLSARLLRRRQADRIAEREHVDGGDVEHVLFNLALSPWQRLARSFDRARRKRVPA